MIERGADFDPFPAFLADLVRGLLQLLRHEAFEQDDVLNEHAVLAFAEQVAPDSASGFFVGLERHEFHAPVVGGDFVARSACRGCCSGSLPLPVREFVPDAFLRLA